MKKFKLRKFNITLFYFLIFMYLELVFRIFIGIQLLNINFIYVLLFNIGVSFILSFITSIKNNFFNKIFFYIILFTTSLIYSIDLCVFKMFGFYFELSLLKATDQVASFAGDGFNVVLNNIFGVLLLFLPFILLLIFNNKVIINKCKWQNNIIKIGSSLLFYGLFILALNIRSETINSAKNLYWGVSNIELSIQKLGVLNSFLIDINRYIFGFQEKISYMDKISIEVEKNPEIIYEYNNLEIDFDSMIANESDNTIKNIHEYFKNETGTLKNKYTGFFEGKNLILFMAESFNEIAVREDITPTLYKLVNNGFVFNNFYTPTISSTIGGEFQELTGLVAASGFLSPWRSGKNYYPMGIANVFKNKNYSTFAYHDHSYTFQDRYKYLASLGFDNFLACGNGLEQRINCKLWPESDVEMINTTVDDYINSENPFFVYYASVSGHGDYSFSYSAMAKKHKEAVAGLNYSEKPLAYLASQIELDKALELLIQKLEENGILEDTVIALVGDHYPYYLSTAEVNEISSYEKDSVVEINHSNFILWNSKMEKVEINKVGSQIDVLPTIYNLFNIPYDSRLIVGKDILSTEPGLAIFGNGSWVSDKGTYYSNKNKFVPKTEEEVSDDYVNYMNSLVSNKIAISKYIMTNDYYKKVLSD